MFCGRSNKNNFPWEIISLNMTALHTRCLWNYEKAMLIKIVAKFRNLLISSFDATIRVKRAFHPTLVSNGNT